MRPLISIAALALALMVLGCGGGGGGGGVSPHAPVISNLQYTPTSAPASSGTTTITGTLDFNDIDGNISTFTLNINVQNGPQVSSTTLAIPNVSGVISGYFDISVLVNTSVPGNYTFGIHVTDSIGLQSNVITRTFIVS